MPSTKDNKWVRRFVIPETTRHRKGFTIYKVTSVIYLKASREEVSKVSVWKRYNDFKKLHSTLHALHAHFQIKDPFPPFTKSKFFGRFEVEVVQERKNSALKFLDFIGKHRCLYTSDIFIKFFENSSLNDSDTINDRSQSVGSDTSEDDHNIAGLNDAGLTNNIQIIESARLSLGNIIDLTTEEESRSFDVEESPFEIAGPLKEVVVEEQEEECCCVTAKGINKGFVISASDGLKLDERYNKDENNKRYELKKTRMLKIKNPRAIQDCTDLAHTCKDVTHYIVVAAAYISAAFKHEAIAEYEEAFAQYKMGISTLLLGVETDPDDARKIIIKEKVSKYLDRAEKLYNRYLNWNISLLNKPTTDLKNYKVLNIIDSLMLVKDLHTNNVRIVKSIEKPLSNKENSPISDYILRGQIPFMVRLHGYIETEATVFLILEYVKRGRLWDFIMKNYKSQDEALKADDDYHSERIRLGIRDECQTTFEGIYNEENERKLITDERFRPYDVEESTRLNSVTSKEDNAQCQILYNVDEICGSDVPTTQLLEKAQKLLKSVNATLRRSNFVVNRSNESKEEFIRSRENVSRALEMSNEVASQFKESSSSVDNNLKRFLTDSLDYSFANAQDTPSSNSSDASTSNSIITDDIKQEECYSTYENNIGTLRINDGIEERTKCFSKNNSQDEECARALWEIPEEVVCRWAAEILLALEALHQQGVIIFDLKPEKILLDEHGRATLTYIVPYRKGELTKIREQEYSSPELYMFSPTTCISPATDIWNYGIILYELLTGIKFRSLHGEPFRSHNVVSVPNKLSDNARSLLLNILKYDPEERLTISDIKKHYFFEKIDWSSMVYSTI